MDVFCSFWGNYLRWALFINKQKLKSADGLVKNHRLKIEKPKTVQNMKQYLRILALVALIFLPGYSQAQYYTATLLNEGFERGIPEGWWGSTTTMASVLQNGLTNASASYENEPTWNYEEDMRNGIDGHHYWVGLFSNNQKAWIITPSMDFTNSTAAQLSFKMAITHLSEGRAPDTLLSEDKKFVILYTINNGNTWAVLNGTPSLNSMVHPNGNFNYESYAVDLAPLVGHTAMLAFYCESNSVNRGQGNVHIDDVRVDIRETCAKVTSVTATALSDTSVRISWSNIGDSDPDSYTIKNGDDVLTTVTDATSVVLTNLTPNTEYTIIIVANCSNNLHSQPSDEVIVRTLCEPLSSIPYTCDFNSSTELPQCWYRPNNNGSATSLSINTRSNYSHSGSYSLKSYIGTRDNDLYIVLPGLDLSVLSLADLQLNFWGRASADNRTVTIGTMSNPNDPSTFSEDRTFTPTKSSFSEYKVAFLNSEINHSTNKYIAIRFNKPASGSSTIYIDDIAIVEREACNEPTNIAVSNITPTSATFTWIDNMSRSAEYTLYYDQQSHELADPEVFTYTVTGLTPATTYDNQTFELVTECANGVQTRLYFPSFSTPCMPAPTYPVDN